MEVTAGNNNIQMQALKRKVNEQILGLTAITEALARKLKEAEDRVSSYEDLINSMRNCARTQQLYDEDSNSCVNAASDAAPTPEPTPTPAPSYASCSGGHSHGSTWSSYVCGIRVTFICNNGTAEQIGGFGAEGNCAP